MDPGQLEVDVANLFARLPVRLIAQNHHPLQQLRALIVVSDFEVDLGHNLVDFTVRSIVFALELLVHFQRLIQQVERATIVTCVAVALPETIQDVGVILSRFLHELEHLPVCLQRSRQVLEGLLVPL